MSEIKPKFPPRVQAIWEDCGTYIETGFHTNEASAKELEFFVDVLLESIALDFDPKRCKDSLTFRGHLVKKKGYL